MKLKGLQDPYPANYYILVHIQNVISISYVSVAEDTGLSPALSGIPKTNPEDRYCRDEAKIKGYYLTFRLLYRRHLMNAKLGLVNLRHR